jgi:lactate dehydrogenase-like 2-hydroxyacid dehydrogenase
MIIKILSYAAGLAKNMKAAGSSLMKRRVINILGSELQGKTLLIIGLGAGSVTT